MVAVEFVSESEQNTRAWGKALGKMLVPGDLIALEGPLGAGKTRLAQGIISGLGINEYVKSPSFTLVHEYKAAFKVCHLDAYRLRGPTDLEDVDYEEYFFGDWICVVEWADRIRGALPPDYLRVEIIPLYSKGESFRLIRTSAQGVRGAQLQEALSCMTGVG